MYKFYAYIRFQTTSPLSIGTDISRETDKDIIKNSKGEPFFPASSLAGVYASLFREKTEREKYFGYVEMDFSKINEKRKRSLESPIIVYDGVLCKESHADFSIRTGIRLDQFGTVKTGAKYDYEILNPGVQFETAIEYTTEEDNIRPLEKILSAYQDGLIVAGGKTARGLGRVQCEQMKVIRFDLSDKRERQLAEF